MKTVGIAIVVSILCGLVFAVGYNASSFGWITQPESALLANMPEPQESSTGLRPNVVAIEPIHDFGTMMGGDNGEHEFVLKNEGDYPLQLKKGKSSCKCTINKFSDTTLEPGESAKVLITWKTSSVRPGKFRQTATILTNDPKRNKVTLTVSGEITVLVRSSRPHLSFSTLTPTESKTLEFNLFSYHLVVNQIEVEDFEFEHAETAKYFEVTFEPLPVDKLEKNATSGVVGKVTLKGDREGLPPFPIGSIRQALRLNTNVLAAKPTKIAISGTIVDELEIRGRGWNNVQKTLDLGKFNDGRGVAQSFDLWVRGPEWEQIEVEVEKTTPEWIKVEIKDVKKRTDLKYQRITFGITIAKDAKVSELVGPEPEKLGHIVLKTNHSKTKTIDIPVRLRTASAVASPVAHEPPAAKPAVKKPEAATPAAAAKSE